MKAALEEQVLGELTEEQTQALLAGVQGGEVPPVSPPQTRPIG